MKLPIPNLEDTQQSLLKHIKPLLNQEEFEKEKLITDNFFLKTAPILQNLLEEEKKESTSSWIYKHWLNMYLACKGSSSIDANFCLDLVLPQNIKDKANEEILNIFSKSLGKVCHDFICNDFEDVVDGRGTKLCLNQFNILKGASRVPKNELDIYNISQTLSNYITIYYKDNLYKIEIFNKDEIFDIEESIQSILNTSKQSDSLLSSFSFLPTKVSANIRDDLYSSNQYFDIIENSLFNISIINKEFKTQEEKRRYMLYLEGSNSWILKPLNFIYNLKEKDFFINSDHSFEDAGTVIEIIKRTFAYAQDMTKTENKSNAILIKEFVDEKNAQIIKEEKEKYIQLSQNFSCKDIHLKLDNETCQKFSKDTIMQMIMLYAQYKTYGTFNSVYEAVDMREYDFGRTECVRPLSVEAINFVKLLDESSDKTELNNSLILANEEHKNRIKSAKKAQGVDRHLFGLKQMLQKVDEEIKKDALKFFNSLAYEKLSKNFISTTCTGTLDFIGYPIFAPVIWEGLGITYLKIKDEIIYLISYHNKQEKNAEDFARYLKEGVEKFKNIYS